MPVPAVDVEGPVLGSLRGGRREVGGGGPVGRPPRQGEVHLWGMPQVTPGESQWKFPLPLRLFEDVFAFCHLSMDLSDHI